MHDKNRTAKEPAPSASGSEIRPGVARLLATWFGCGLAPGAPGTVGTVGALPLYYLLRKGGRAPVALAAVALTGVGVWASDRVAHDLGLEDPQIVVIDEVVGVLIALLAAPFDARGTLAGLALFRLFDIAKPWPIRKFERLPGGWGIMMDDVAAGVMAAGVLLAARSLLAKKGEGLG